MTKPHPKITAEALKAAGYSRYRRGYLDSDGEHWQRTIKGSADISAMKLYFINFTLSEYGASCSVRLYAPHSPSPDGGIEIQPLLDPETDIESVERWIATVYVELECVPDVHNN